MNQRVHMPNSVEQWVRSSEEHVNVALVEEITSEMAGKRRARKQQSPEAR